MLWYKVRGQEKMKEQDIADFESEIRKVCEKYEAKMAHAALVGVLTVVKHLYLEAQLDNFEKEEEGGGSSPLPQEAKRR